MIEESRRGLMRELDESAAGRFRESQGRKKERPSDRAERAADGREGYRRVLATANRAIVHERLIGESDLLRVNYLTRGAMVSRAVGRIVIRDRFGNHLGDGTGFLVGSRTLLTNAHVILNAEEATNSLLELDYEDDAFSLPKPKVVFALRGDDLFLRNRELDYALVAVAQQDIRGQQDLSRYGFLKLRERSGKAISGEAVSIIQHPQGRPKEIAVRSNRVIDVLEHFIHYATDTERGSSGSPVFSDEWEVVALHHAGVRKTNENGEPLNRDGGVWNEEQGEENAAWKANEGIRISSIVRDLASKRDQVDGVGRPLLEEVVEPARAPSAGPYVDRASAVSEERRNAAWYAAAQGYQSDFLGTEAVVQLPGIAQHAGHASEELLYRNFSIVMHTGRRQALFTAVNMDGNDLQPSSRHVGWKLDPRLGAEFQLNNDFYRDQSGRTNRLDRGHLVRRLDPAWGDGADNAIDDTFHWGPTRHFSTDRSTTASGVDWRTL